MERIQNDLTSLRNDFQKMQEQQKTNQRRNDSDSRYMFAIGALFGVLGNFYVSFAMLDLGTASQNQINGGLILTGLPLLVTGIFLSIAEWLRKKDREKHKN